MERHGTPVPHARVAEVVEGWVDVGHSPSWLGHWDWDWLLGGLGRGESGVRRTEQEKGNKPEKYEPGLEAWSTASRPLSLPWSSILVLGGKQE